MIGTAKQHNRKLGLLGADMVRARFKADEMKAMRDVRDEVEGIMERSDYLLNAPFLWITLSLRFGLKNEEEPHYERINTKYGDLPLAIELNSHELVNAELDDLKRLFMIATLKALVHAGHKFRLPTEMLERALWKLSTF